jgi:hypothetical protein
MEGISIPQIVDRTDGVPLFIGNTRPTCAAWH